MAFLVPHIEVQPFAQSSTNPIHEQEVAMCTAVGCKYFQKAHPPGQIDHVYRCNEVNCRDFQQFHVNERPHVSRCNDTRCKLFQQFHVGAVPHQY